MLMAVQYNKLFKMMIDRKMTNNQLAEQARISLNIITRLKRDEYIAMQTIEKICITLGCGVDDILEFIPESKQ
jgi:putative transcriptional regulator